jgi:tetrachlorobenzoquinone reductase
MSPLPDTSPASLDLRLTGVEYAGRDTQVCRLSRPSGGTLPPAAAGSHITLALPLSSSACLERQYSILEPGDALTEYAIAVKREPAGRGGSAFIHDKLRVGEVLRASAPRNHFPLLEAAPTSILIAGGIGVTPLIAMASRLTELGRSFELHVAFRGADYEILPKQLRRLPNVSKHFDDVAGGPFPIAATVAAAPREAHLYCCGPSSMIQAFLECASADRREEALLHVEYFSSTSAPATAGSFIVELARSGRAFTVPPGASILRVLQEAGVSTLSNCEQGVCGACEVRVLEGVPDHRDAVLSPRERKEGKSMMICCSGALTDRLVLDL